MIVEFLLRDAFFGDFGALGFEDQGSSACLACLQLDPKPLTATPSAATGRVEDASGRVCNVGT